MRTTPTTIAAALLAVLAAGPLAAPASARSRLPALRTIRCVPARSVLCAGGVRASTGKQVQLSGRRLQRGMRVTFRWSRGALATTLRRTRVGWVATVPPGTRAGLVSVSVLARGRRRSNALRLRIVAPPRLTSARPAARGVLPAAFAGQGMWIWELARSEGGDVAAIAARARAGGLQTVFVKAGDGTRSWSQFSPALVAALHAQGLRACAWQYVYGASPEAEAAVAAAAIRVGADCFAIDAESEYQGRYAPAQRYLRALRGAVGDGYPVGFTSFPYVDYHPAVPYSVFLGPGGAQANLPQVYWGSIGGGVDAVSARTLAHNRAYGAAIAPLGQAYGSVAAADVARFRAIWAGYGAGGVSWWSWQAASAPAWSALTGLAPAALPLPDPGWPALRRGAQGDEVVWLQQHLVSAAPAVAVTGVFDAATSAALAAFQTAHGLPGSAVADAPTWAALLSLPMRAVDWVGATTATASSARRGSAARAHAPLSAALPARREEIPATGAGR